MPHVVFDKKIDLELFSKEFQEKIIKKSFLIKITDVFLDRKKRIALIPTVVIDNLHQQFFIEISTRQDKTTIRLFPGTDPEKTDGVKMSLGLVTKIVQEINPNHRITRTNIREFLLPDQSSLVIT